ncbi:MAG: amidohydrolase family protein [Pseudomonadales bacterium]|nr:amidohydrolase family protein [Pseudomonadales bacterium]
MQYDIKITGGTILDGSGEAGYAGDVGIKDGKVVALGSAPGDATKTIDATGKLVTPGFVDIHTHYDAQIMWDKMLTISPWHGVTTVVMGNCGFGIAPTRPEHRLLIAETLENVEGMSVAALKAGLGEEWSFETFPEYMDAIEASGTAINVGVLLGHTPLRMYVMGEDATEREATTEEIAEMKSIVAEGLEAGAIGFATSKARTHVGYRGKPVPSRLACPEELKQLTGALGDAQKGMIQATIGEGMSYDQFAEITKDTGRRISWTALLSGVAIAGPGGYQAQLRKSEELIAAGHDVVPQVTCRPLNFEFNFKAPFLFESSKVFKPVSQSDFEGRKKIYADPDFRERFKQMLAKPGNGLGAGFPKSIVSNCSSDESVNERLLSELAEERGQHIVDVALDISLANELEVRFRMPVANDNEDEVQELLDHPETVLGLSDAGAHASQLCDACFSTHLLGHWVRDKGTIPIERAIRMLTSRPAEVFGITDRGTLAEGKPADVVVIDLENVGASNLERVYDLPADQDRLISEAAGIDAVIVNGVMLRENNVDQVDPNKDSLPGRLLRNGAAQAQA